MKIEIHLPDANASADAGNAPATGSLRFYGTEAEVREAAARLLDLLPGEELLDVTDLEVAFKKALRTVDAQAVVLTDVRCALDGKKAVGNSGVALDVQKLVKRLQEAEQRLHELETVPQAEEREERHARKAAEIETALAGLHQSNPDLYWAIKRLQHPVIRFAYPAAPDDLEMALTSNAKRLHPALLHPGSNLPPTPVDPAPGEWVKEWKEWVDAAGAKWPKAGPFSRLAGAWLRYANSFYGLK